MPAESTKYRFFHAPPEDDSMTSQPEWMRSDAICGATAVYLCRQDGAQESPGHRDCGQRSALMIR